LYNWLSNPTQESDLAVNCNNETLLEVEVKLGFLLLDCRLQQPHVSSKGPWVVASVLTVFATSATCGF